MILSVCAIKLSSSFFLVAFRTKGLAQVGVTGISLPTCHRLHGTALPTRGQFLQPLFKWLNYGFTQFDAARLNILVYSFTQPWHDFNTGEGRTLPGSHLPRDSKIYLALNLRFSVVHRNIYLYACPPNQATVGVLGLQRTLEFMSTSWSFFSKLSQWNIMILGKKSVSKSFQAKVQSTALHTIYTNNKQPAKHFSGTPRTAIWKGGQEVKHKHLVF